MRLYSAALAALISLCAFSGLVDTNSAPVGPSTGLDAIDMATGTVGDLFDVSVPRWSATGTVFRAASVGNAETWTDATGCVWRVSVLYRDAWVLDDNGDKFIWKKISPNEWETVEEYGLWGYGYVRYVEDLSELLSDYPKTNGWIAARHNSTPDFVVVGAEDATSFNEMVFRGDVVETNLVGRVLYTGEAVTPQELAEAVSTNNPAFVSAVRDTPPAEGVPWGGYGTIGAAVAGLFAIVALMARRSAFADEYSATSSYTVGDHVWHGGGLYQCKAAIASPGEAWTAAHWDGPRQLDDLFSGSTSFTPPTTVAGALKNSTLEKSIVLAVTENFADADSTAYGSAE